MEVTLIHKKCVEKHSNRQLKAELASVYVNTVEPGQERAKPIILLYQHLGEDGDKLVQQLRYAGEKNINCLRKPEKREVNKTTG